MAEESTENEKPASCRISARRTEAEARMSFMVNPGISGGEEYYSASAVTACALVQPKRRAIWTGDAAGYRVRYFVASAVRASSDESLPASAVCFGKARETNSKRLEAHAAVSCSAPECVTIRRPWSSSMAFLKRLLPAGVSIFQA